MLIGGNRRTQKFLRKNCATKHKYTYKIGQLIKFMDIMKDFNASQFDNLLLEMSQKVDPAIHAKFNIFEILISLY